jgi:hypothetical protein
LHYLHIPGYLACLEITHAELRYYMESEKKGEGDRGRGGEKEGSRKRGRGRSGKKGEQ